MITKTAFLDQIGPFSDSIEKPIGKPIGNSRIVIKIKISRFDRKTDRDDRDDRDQLQDRDQDLSRIGRPPLSGMIR